MSGSVNDVLDHLVKISRAWVAHYDPPIDVAFICTGNICRSPMAEALLRARLAAVAPQVTVGSAGLLFEDRQADPQVVKLMAKRGIDLRGHRARIISADLLADTTIILGMERHHVRQVANLDASFFARSFTLPEFLAASQVFAPPRPGDDLRSWVEQVGAARTEISYAAEDPLMEIRDPHGGPGRVYRECADRIEVDVAELVQILWPQTTPSTGGIHADRDRI